MFGTVLLDPSLATWPRADFGTRRAPPGSCAGPTVSEKLLGSWARAFLKEVIAGASDGSLVDTVPGQDIWSMRGTNEYRG